MTTNPVLAAEHLLYGTDTFTVDDLVDPDDRTPLANIRDVARAREVVSWYRGIARQQRDRGAAPERWLDVDQALSAWLHDRAPKAA